MKNAILVLAIVFAAICANASGKLELVPSKEFGKEMPKSEMAVGLNVKEELVGPLHFTAYSKVDYSFAEKGSFQEFNQDLGLALELGKYLEIEPGLSFNRGLKAGDEPKWDKKAYVKILMQMW